MQNVRALESVDVDCGECGKCCEKKYLQYCQLINARICDKDTQGESESGGGSDLKAIGRATSPGGVAYVHNHKLIILLSLKANTTNA